MTESLLCRLSSNAELLAYRSSGRAMSTGFLHK
jgi:hypothetical protein